MFTPVDGALGAEDMTALRRLPEFRRRNALVRNKRAGCLDGIWADQHWERGVRLGTTEPSGPDQSYPVVRDRLRVEPFQFINRVNGNCLRRAYTPPSLRLSMAMELGLCRPPARSPRRVCADAATASGERRWPRRNLSSKCPLERKRQPIERFAFSW